MPATRSVFRCVIFLIIGSLPIWAQDPSREVSEKENVEVRQETVLKSLAVLMRGIEDQIAELQTLREKADNAAEKLQFFEQLKEQENELERLKLEFLSFAVRVDEGELGPVKEEPLSIQAEVKELLNPLFSELKDATAGPRKLEALRRKQQLLVEEKTTLVKVLTGLEERRAEVPDGIVAERLIEIQEVWMSKMENLKARLDVTSYKIKELEKDDESVLTRSSRGFQSFFRTRGKNLLIAALGALLTFFLIRKGYAFFRNLNPAHRKKGNNFYIRALDLLIHIFSVLLAIGVFVIVLYLANDWVMLVVTLLILGGLGWAGKQVLPQYMEQWKLMLNFGPVREGERIIYDGVPWKVGRVRPYTNFTNAELKGGLIRLPIRQLVELHSRPHEGELWFPCRQGDWVRLSDDTFGKIIEQTPEHVQVLRLGGIRKIIPTASFLEMNPENLSRSFRVFSTFGIDYQYQDICTTEVPRIFQEALERALRDVVDPDQIKNVSVQFSSASASSLDYEILADFSGEAAPRYRSLQRAIQRICVDVCNEKGWEIPFAQMTIHQAP